MKGTSAVLATTAVLIAIAYGDTSNERVCPGKPADVIFIMDESSSIWPVHFKKQREFLANLTDGFEISSDKTRIAVVSFADDYTPRFQLDTFQNNKDVKAAVNRIHQKTGGTRTDLALEYVRTIVLARARTDVPRIVILVTDGASWYPERTKTQAELLKKQNVSTIAVAISNQPFGKINWEEINAIATRPVEKHTFSVTSFDGLGQQLVNDLVDTTCEIKSNPPAALLPPLDKETSRKALPPGIPTIRIYSERTANIKSEDGKLYWRKPAVASTELNLSGQSVLSARQESLQGRHGVLSIGNADRVTVESRSDLTRKTEYVSSYDKLSDGQPTSISVSTKWSDGPISNTIEVRPSGEVKSQSSINLDIYRNELPFSLHRVISGYTKTQMKECRASTKVDLAIVLGSIGQNPRGAEQGLTIVESFVRDANTFLHSDSLRLALAPSACELDIGFDFNDHSDRTSVLKQLERSRRKFLSTADHLSDLREHVFNLRSGARTDSLRVTVVLMDRPSLDKAATLVAARRLREDGVKMVAIGVGSSVDQDELTSIAPDARHVFTVSSYSHVDAIKSYIYSIIC